MAEALEEEERSKIRAEEERRLREEQQRLEEENRQREERRKAREGTWLNVMMNRFCGHVLLLDVTERLGLSTYVMFLSFYQRDQRL